MGEKGARTRCAGGPFRLRILVCVRAIAGLRRARALEPKRCASQRNRKFADGGLTSGRKSSNWSSRAKPDEAVRGAGGMRLDRSPSPSRSASAARLARLVKKRKGGRPKGHRQPRRRTGCTPEKTTLFKNDTPRPEPAPAGMLQGLPIAAERRAVGWGNGERRWRGRCDVDRWPSRGAGRARAARSGLCRPPPGYFSTFPG